mgnify:CR=1 FL=1|tara:strand:+ start:466 stop:729 length:264 start_codon:yes stop_codon:yes gene_type:complete
MLSEVFWTIFLTTVSGFLLKLASMAYKSKCKSCKVCCIEVIRDTEAEIELDEMVVNRQPILPPSPSGNNIESNNNDIEINKPFSDKI